ncbi:AraC family transcriptional regulator [Horticoccus luteus]|uniref:AraC family transcriptional regulator n=1 Tax=Horticoccus luteus TaxID=2862869 RepID=A0A8F9TUD3_9BACT|nr:AraC family transcriptional regulator [Horticoccus luteus]QYM79439.1 AraC family transcriptional regulator [Horticoccus luteus]
MSVVWQMPLKNQPVLVQAGLAVHGQKRRVEEYLLPELWAVHLYRYEAEIELDGHRMTIGPGCAGVTPPNTRIVYRYKGESRHIFAHFRLATGGDLVAMQAVQDAGEVFAELAEGLEQAAGWLPAQPRRASVRLWDVLWQLAGAPMAEREPRKRLHPALGRAVREIELRMAEKLSIPDIAKRAEVSHNHLTRLFRAQFGVTVEGYIRQRRVERAQHLLAHSTLAIKTIAAEVGLPDLHFFNKTVRAASGLSPREYRERAGA